MIFANGNNIYKKASSTSKKYLKIQVKHNNCAEQVNNNIKRQQFVVFMYFDKA